MPDLTRPCDPRTARMGQPTLLSATPSYTVNNKEEAAAASWVIPAAFVGKVLGIMEITRKCHDNTTGNVSLEQAQILCAAARVQENKYKYI